jgi:hypothetical protein
MIDSIRKERALQTSDLRPIAINNGIASPTTLSFACFQVSRPPALLAAKHYSCHDGLRCAPLQWRLPVCPLQRADFAAHRRAGPIMAVAESAAASSLFTVGSSCLSLAWVEFSKVNLMGQIDRIQMQS